MSLCMYVVMQVRKKKLIKSKTINHYENNFIYERSNTNTSRSISQQEYISPHNIQPSLRLEYNYGTNIAFITSLNAVGR